MSGRSMCRLIPALSCLLAASLVLADEPDGEKARAAASSEHGRKEVGALTIRAAGPAGEEFQLIRKPVLKWSNPIRGSVYGDVYIWTLKGRPEVVGSFLEWFQPIQSKEIELHSLSLGPLVAERPDQLSWTTDKAGVDFKPIPGAPAAAATAALRLRQMRELAKDFTARQISHTGIEYEMRLLLQPIYRYEGTEGDLVDGALFAIVHAGDPEVFLQIEARQDGRFRRMEVCLGPVHQHLSCRPPQGARNLDRQADRALDSGSRSPPAVHGDHARTTPAVNREPA